MLIKLHGHYDNYKTATVRATDKLLDGLYTGSIRQLRAAEKRAHIIKGDWLESDDCTVMVRYNYVIYDTHLI